ncbi:MAG: flavin reductase family protein [Pseudoruegeria sp.]
MADGGRISPMDSFVPGPDTARLFRNSLGRFATGITVVTAQTPDGPIGITANSFASVSLEPALVLWSPAKDSKRFKAFSNAENYAIHVLGEDQMELCQTFAKKEHTFDGLAWTACDMGVPLIEGCLARFECKKHAEVDAGDHVIIIGQVKRASIRDGAPLLFSSGQFGHFAPGH